MIPNDTPVGTILLYFPNWEFSRNPEPVACRLVSTEYISLINEFELAKVKFLKDYSVFSITFFTDLVYSIPTKSLFLSEEAIAEHLLSQSS